MALTSITVTATNSPYTCSVIFTSTANVEFIGSITKIEIYRKIYGNSGLGNKIYSKTISSVEDLSFTVSDITNKSGIKYVYTVQTVNSSSQVIEYSEYTVTSEFCGLFIGDYVKSYVAPLNCQTKYTQKTQSNYVTTLASRTPYKIANSALNYASGESSAMFLQLDNNNNPIPDYTGEYSEEVISYLSDGNEKILKTGRGEIWYVTIDDSVDVDPNGNIEGTRTISFNWTEIGDIPLLRTV